MNQYELMTITNIELGDEGAQSLSNEIKDLILSFKGKVLDSDSWGKRKFSYEINGKTEGYYEVLTFELEAQKLPEFRTKLNFLDNLVRYLITKKDK